MGTKNKPGNFDCYANAEPNEPIFTVLGRDPNAGDSVRKWADDREALIKKGEKPTSDILMVHEARRCARSMDRYCLDRGRVVRRGETWDDSSFVDPHDYPFGSYSL